MKISDRLLMISENIEQDEIVADIGTDHGFLPLYLCLIEKCNKVILSDISENSLDKAKKNCKLIYPNKEFDFRLGSGIEVLEDNEVDAVVIAGMGGILMTEILENNLTKSHSFKKFILQPRSQIGRLRHWLYNNEFEITNEQLVREGNRICEILTVRSSEKMHLKSVFNIDSVEMEIPNSLIYFYNNLTVEYITKKLSDELQIKRNLEFSKKNNGNKKIININRIKYIKELLSQLENKNE